MKDMVRVLVLTLAGLAAWPGATVAEDTDLFMAAPPGAAAANPNVLIILDNSANWSASLASGKKFDAEIAALNSVLGGLTDSFNVGLMLFGETGGGNSNPVTSYMRYAVRTMNGTNRPSLQSLITGLHQTNDKGSNAPYGLGLFETFKYFGGGALSPSDATHFGPTAFGGAGQKKRDYAGNPDNSIAGPLAGNAFTSVADITYESPVADGCAKNYVIYLSNGLPQSGADNAGGGNPNAQTLLQNVGGNITTIPLTNNTAQGNIGDEYARFLYNADVSSLSGQQNISTYTIFTHDPTSLGGNDNANIVLLKSMANQGHGKYFAASDTASLINALKTIFNEIQSVNDVFAAVSLPVSVNVSGTSLNQIYMGVFRPDPDSLPRWMGNLKEYQLIVSGDKLYLGDKNGIRADNPTNGFITDNAVSYWTSPSTFWNYSPSGNPLSGSDSPDGPIVEKGAAAQRLRESFAASQTTRKLYTCTTCASDDALSATPFNTTTISPNSSANQTAFGVSNTAYSNTNVTPNSSGKAGEVTDIINWVRGADNNTDENGNGSYTDIRASIHGDVVHSRPAVINYNGTGTCTSPAENDVYVFYGANDGVFHALKGGKGDTDGVEKWGFIPPEFYGKLKRLRDNAPANTVNTLPPADTSNNKSYFADGSVSTYQVDANNDCRYTTGTSGDKVHIFVSMRRGGRFIYALDVTDPDSPRMLWKITNSTSGFAELGYTWSTPAVALVNLGGTATPVLVFGGGYDPAVEDINPASITGTTTTTVTTNTTSPATTITRSMGRRIFVVKASDGSLVWSAGGVPAAVPQLTVTGMDFALPSDVVVLDTNADGVDDRFYVGDTGGKVWRADIGGGAPASWAVTELAAIDSSSTARRKFLNPPVVVAGQEAGTNYHAVLIGSGDREHPFNTTVANRFYMFKDSDTGLMSEQTTPITEADLFNATNALPTGTNNGWRIDLATGEKVVTGATVLSGTTFFNTNIPPAAPAPGVCTSNLGTAHLYAVGYADGAGTLFNSYDDPADAANLGAKFTEQAGGGFQPSPVPAVVEVDGTKYQALISGTIVTTVPGPSFGARLRTYLYEDIE